MEEHDTDYPLDKLRKLAEDAGLEHFDGHAMECDTLVFRDRDGEYHECWDAGSPTLVNVTVAMTPEDAVNFSYKGLLQGGVVRGSF